MRQEFLSNTINFLIHKVFSKQSFTFKYHHLIIELEHISICMALINFHFFFNYKIKLDIKLD